MKRVLFVATVLLSFSVGTAQTRKKAAIPAAVTDAFQKDYPNTSASWEVEGNGFEAEFTRNGTEASANYDQSGHRTETEVEIKADKLPAKAVAYLQKNHPSQKVRETSKITNDKGIVTYEAELKKGNTPVDLLFDASGNFIK